MNLGIFSILFGVLVSLAPGLVLAKSKATPKGTLNCARKHLLQKDCWIALGKFQIHVWNDKILLNSQVDRLTQPLPVHGADMNSQAISWEFIRGKKIGQRHLLETGLWTPPQGEGEVETLVWTVYEVTRSELRKRLEQPIQKRKKVEAEKYKFDKMVKHGLGSKGGKISWHVQREQGVF